MNSHGFDLTTAAVRRHLTALPWPRYELRLIDALRRQSIASRYWTAAQLLAPDVIGFLRARNREGCDIYFRPFAPQANAGYLLLDFDAGPCPLDRMRQAGHQPCVVIETSPGHQQAWVRISSTPVEPSLATATARSLASLYGADPASAEWRHLGRLAGFTNRKPTRRQSDGQPPWVRWVWQGGSGCIAVSSVSSVIPRSTPGFRSIGSDVTEPASAYRRCLDELRLLARFPAPDWSVADYRVARVLLSQGWDAAQVAEALRSGSPGFPRFHSDPHDYLQRTVRRAAESLALNLSFSRAPARTGSR